MGSFEWACKNGELEEVKTLVKAGQDVNEKFNGRCALHFAADYGHPAVLQFLVDNGADVNAEDKYGITPLCAAVFENHADCVEALLKSGAKKDGKTPDGRTYLQAAEKAEIKELLEEGDNRLKFR